MTTMAGPARTFCACLGTACLLRARPTRASPAGRSTLPEICGSSKSRGLASAGAAGLGFALLRRDLFTQMIEAYPERRMQTEGMWNFFPVEAVDGVFIDEDYSFCKLWRDTGGEIWVDLNVRSFAPEDGRRCRA